MKILWMVAIAAIAVTAFAASASAQTLKVVSEADLFPQGNHRFIVHSEMIGRDFAVTVTMPVAYAKYRPPPTKVAAIYALDNGYDVAGPIAQMLSRTTDMSPAYVVSVGYIEGQPNMRGTDDRFEGEGAGGVAFQHFLTSELRPFIEARYPLDPAKAVLFGHSAGGTFAVNVLTRSPRAFFGYVIGSPAVSVAEAERLAKAAPKADGARVFLGVGSAETPDMLDSEKQVAEALLVKGSTVKLESQVFAGAHHTAYYPQLATAAFEWLLPPSPSRKAIMLTDATYARLVGDYRTDDGRVINISHASNKTMIAIIGVPGYTELDPDSPQSFFVRGLDLPVVTFEGAADKPATAITVALGGVPTRAVRQK